MANLQKKKKHSRDKVPHHYDAGVPAVCSSAGAGSLHFFHGYWIDIYKMGILSGRRNSTPDAYEYIAKTQRSCWTPIVSTIEVTVIGTFFGLLFTAMLAIRCPGGITA